jgi:hypothetical protein
VVQIELGDSEEIRQTPRCGSVTAIAAAKKGFA